MLEDTTIVQEKGNKINAKSIEESLSLPRKMLGRILIIRAQEMTMRKTWKM